MASKILFLSAVVAVMYSEAAPQFFGGRQDFLTGGNSEKFGYQAGPLWGSLSQTHNAQGFSSPITYEAGGKYVSPQGHGGGASLAVIPGIGGKGSLQGQLGLLNNPRHEVNLVAQHDRFLDKNLKPIGPETNSLGLNYANKDNGASAFLTGSQANGSPARGTAGVSIPIVNTKDASVSATGQTTFGHGMKPVNQVGIEVNIPI